MRNMNVQFDDSSQPRIIKKSSKEYLQSLKVGYDCDWPIEIVIDRLTVQKKYNKVFKLLVHIKYAKYLMEKKDYHIREPNLLKTTSSYTYAKNYENMIDEMGARERVALENKIMLG